MDGGLGRALKSLKRGSYFRIFRADGVEHDPSTKTQWHFICIMSVISALELGPTADLTCCSPMLSKLVASSYM